MTDKIKSYEDACLETGDPFISDEQFAAKGFEKDEISYRKLKTITKALNECWECNAVDYDCDRFYPLFDVDEESFIYKRSDYSSLSVDVSSGEFLSFKARRLSEYAGRQFPELYFNLMIK